MPFRDLAQSEDEKTFTHEILALRARDNGRMFQILAVVAVGVCFAFTAQNILDPGTPEGSSIPYYLISVYAAFGILSCSLFVFLRLYCEKLPSATQIVVYIYALIATTTTTSLTIIDLAHIHDYSGYLFGMLGLPLFLRAKHWVYVVMIIYNFIYFLIGYSYFVGKVIGLPVLTPIFVFSLSSWFSSIIIERTRVRANILQLKLVESNRHLTELSYRDPLTGLHNRRYLIEALSSLIANARRYRLELSILLLDVDHFKKTNDKFGHLVGDAILAKLGRHLGNLIRESDLAARYGGEEFCIVLTSTRKREASRVAERIRKSVEQHRFEEVPWRITVSIGVSSLKKSQTMEDLLKTVDENLYKAKSRGRNKVVSV
ncbi:hypothetical protein CH373_07140 [Leptospira perolatii]|uniref:diguanylate cyclase n=1 Tax=Leptospira perolatii TaxID=2023191 RepID=A0A2M9ZPB4_9LEPT|nr:GGDEF domain-containing protein [Leptospira perolatii]PJZ70697.1 hypothetical protein CH360_04000 [Leptospira perolatii]PJZ73907.1 hypothetical protein CH373_07140 [Leptospira perolatii]